MNAVVGLRNLARQNILAVLLSTILQGVNPKNCIMQRGLTRICIEGYPRSANSFAVRLFRMANNDVHIGHHTHSTANVARALRYGIPVVVLIRNPIDAITSSVIAKGRGDIDDEVWYYLTFYRWVEPRVDSVVIAEFETVITDFNRVIKQVNEKYNTVFNYIEDLDAATRQTVQFFRKRARERGIRRELRWMAVPYAEREKLKEELRPYVACHERIGDAQALYAQLTDLS